jgi:hypothetical protein
MEISGIAVSLFDLSGFRLINAGSAQPISLHTGTNRVKVSIRSLHLKPGTYQIALWMAGQEDLLFDQILSAAYLNVVPRQEPVELDLNPYHDKVTAQVEVSLLETGSAGI